MDKEALRRGQQGDPLCERVKSHLLHEEVSADPEQNLDTGSFLLGDRKRLWHAPAGKEKTVLAIHRALVPELTSLSM